MLGFVEAKIGDRPNPSSDKFQEEWRIGSSVMVSPNENPQIGELIKTFRAESRKSQTSGAKLATSSLESLREN
jgi:hypothetical protein